MLHRVFSVYDAAAAAYLPPFYNPTSQSAIRSFSEMVSQPDHAFSKHAKDFTLFTLGSFDDTDCSFELNETPTAIATALEIKAQMEN